MNQKLKDINSLAKTVFILTLAVAVTGCGVVSNRSFKMTTTGAKPTGLPAISFKFSYSKKFKLQKGVALFGERKYVVLSANSGDRLREQLAVGYLYEAAGKRLKSAQMPIVMERYRQEAEKRYSGYRFLQEGWTKVGDLGAYQLFFTANASPVASGGVKRGKIQGRMILLPRQGLTGGVVITALAGRAAGFDRSTQVGSTGLSKSVLESFVY